MPRQRHPCAHSGHLFGAGVLPEIALPTIGYLTKPMGEWHRYCRGWHGFNAVLPVSWELTGVGYSEHHEQQEQAA